MTFERMVQLVRMLTDAPGSSGEESCAAEFAAGLLQKMGKVSVSPLGSVECVLKAGREGAPCILLEAHLDQIGLSVTRVESNGFLRVTQVGGIDRRLLPASRVRIYTDTGVYPGVVAVPANTAADTEKVPELSEFFVDTGIPAEGARELFTPGDRVLFEQNFRLLGKDTVVSRALDDRICCAAVLAAAEDISQMDVSCRVVVLLSSQEETGGAGAETSAFRIQPDFALVSDVSFGDGYGLEEHECGKMGGGPMIGIAPILNKKTTAHLRRIAAAHQIPVQLEVMGGRTGTDADSIACSGTGVRTALLSIPQRSMHTPVETCRISDTLHTARLMAEFVREVDTL